MPLRTSLNSDLMITMNRVRQKDLVSIFTNKKRRIDPKRVYSDVFGRWSSISIVRTLFSLDRSDEDLKTDRHRFVKTDTFTRRRRAFSIVGDSGNSSALSSLAGRLMPEISWTSTIEKNIWGRINDRIWLMVQDWLSRWDRWSERFWRELPQKAGGAVDREGRGSAFNDQQALNGG
jgi:hypothetical protein